MDKDKKKIIFLGLVGLLLIFLFELLWWVIHYYSVELSGTQLNKNILFVNIFPVAFGMLLTIIITVSGLKRIYSANIDIKENKKLIAKVMSLGVIPALIGTLYTVWAGNAIKEIIFNIR